MKFFYLIAGLFDPVFYLFYFLTGLKSPAKKQPKNEGWKITIR